MIQTHPDGFLAQPAAGTGPGILLLHAWWGLNDTIKTFCNQLADQGFTVFAPDLYHGQVVDTVPEAEKLARFLDENYQQARAEVAEAAVYLAEQPGRSEGRIAVVGFSLGAFYALDLANEKPDLVKAVVLFYGTGEGAFTRSSASYLGHFAEDDPYEPQTNVDKLEKSLQQSGHPVAFYRYKNTGHWFCEPDRPEAYYPAAASLVWERTLAFLNQNQA